MFHILGFFLAIVLVIVIVTVTFIGRILKTIFGLENRHTSQQQTNHQHTYGRQQSYDSNDDSGYEEGEDVRGNGHPQTPRKKIFTEDEGEYVDFEEIK